MPVRHVPNTNPPLEYYLVVFDEQGRERRETGNSLLSEKVLAALGSEPVTDVFAMSHGWRADVAGAIAQYDDWSKNLMGQTADIQAMTQRRPGFRPMLVGLHWPSEPWGNESIAGSFAIDAAAPPLEDTVAKAAAEQNARLCGGAEAEAELRTIYRAYATTDSPDTLPAEVEAAYRRLNGILRLGSEGTAPGQDMPAFDPQAIFHAAKRDAEVDLLTGGSFGGLDWGSILAPLKILSFWCMKDRARTFGEGGAHGLLLAMQHQTASKDVRIHLMGHSFGCIVMTGAAAGPKDDAVLRKPVQSMVLAQGALSLWAYCESMPHGLRRPGYFSRLVTKRRCEGPIATTQSQYDTSVGKAYPLAAGLAQQESFDVSAELPTYGGVGTFGIQGIDALTAGRKMGSASEDYGFQGGRIYNLDGSDVISGNHGQQDAHNDIVHPEVAHVIWQAALPGA
jgi:hypothetical protein